MTSNETRDHIDLLDKSYKRRSCKCLFKYIKKLGFNKIQP